MEFEKENLKRKNDESKDALKSKYLKNQIFQLDLELSQVTDEADNLQIIRILIGQLISFVLVMSFYKKRA